MNKISVYCFPKDKNEKELRKLVPNAKLNIINNIYLSTILAFKF